MWYKTLRDNYQAMIVIVSWDSNNDESNYPLFKWIFKLICKTSLSPHSTPLNFPTPHIHNSFIAPGK